MENGRLNEIDGVSTEYVNGICAWYIEEI